MDERLAFLTLAVLDLSPARAARIRAAGLAEVLENPEDHTDVLCEPTWKILRSKEAISRAATLQRCCAERGIAIVALCDAEYPRLLKQISDPPPVLFVQGQPACLSASPAIGIVGTRAATARGQALARELAAELASAGAVVISGLARGIDAAAHRGAVEAGGATLGVLGGGFDHFYPPENLGLGRAMIRRGAIVSEFPLEVTPHAGRFPQRNRVIAGLCQGLVVVEAPFRSGALVTARLALEAGREVMAVPGFPGLRHTEGTNELLRDGATLIRHAADVAASLGLELVPEGSVTGPRGGCPVQGALTPGVPYGLEEIRDLTGLQSTGLLSRLSELELQGVIRRLPGARYVLGTVRKSS